MKRGAPKSLPELVQEFADTVLAWERGGTTQQVNRLAKQKGRIVEEIAERFGDQGREALTSLFMHEALPVRKMAAFFLLRYCHDRAKRVLEEIAKTDELEASRVEWMLHLWYAGEWKLDPGPMPPHSGFNTKPLFP